MKIKILSPIGAHSVGEIVEAIRQPNSNNMACFEKNGVLQFYYFPAYEVLEDKVQNNESLQKSLRDIFGQDMERIEFK